MPVKTEPMKQIRLKPEVHDELLKEQGRFPFKVALWELANSAILAGLKALSLERGERKSK